MVLKLVRGCAQTVTINMWFGLMACSLVRNTAIQLSRTMFITTPVLPRHQTIISGIIYASSLPLTLTLTLRLRLNREDEFSTVSGKRLTPVSPRDPWNDQVSNQSRLGATVQQCDMVRNQWGIP